MKTLPPRIVDKLHEFINRVIFLEKKKVFYFEGLKLYPSEIYLILVISLAPGKITQMAAKLYIATGAVSQAITRLEKKGVVEKTSDPRLKNELTLSFTPVGQRVFEKYKQMNRAMDNRFKGKISIFSAGELMTIDRFLDHMLEIPQPTDKSQSRYL